MLQNLVEAIKNKDWEGVISFYESFSGVKFDTGSANERSKPVKRKKVAIQPVEPIQPVVTARTGSILRDMDFSVKHGKPVRKRSNVVEPPKPKGRKKAKVGKARLNKFEEIVPTLVVVEPGEAHVNDQVPLAPRVRPAFAPKSIKCELCSETFEVAPAFVREGWKCDGCILKNKPK